MGPRQLKAHLRVLREAGVKNYTKTADGYTVEFHDPVVLAEPQQVAPTESGAEGLDLPEENWDPRDMLRRIHEKHAGAGRHGKVS